MTTGASGSRAYRVASAPRHLRAGSGGVPFFAATAEEAAADGARMLSWPDAAHYLLVHHAERTAEVLLDLVA